MLKLTCALSDFNNSHCNIDLTLILLGKNNSKAGEDKLYLKYTNRDFSFKKELKPQHLPFKFYFPIKMAYAALFEKEAGSDTLFSELRFILFESQATSTHTHTIRCVCNTTSALDSRLIKCEILLGSFSRPSFLNLSFSPLPFLPWSHGLNLPCPSNCSQEGITSPHRLLSHPPFVLRVTLFTLVLILRPTIHATWLILPFVKEVLSL